MGFNPNKEYLSIANEGHATTCRVYDGYYWMDACNCGAVEVPDVRKLPGLANYEILSSVEVRNLATGRKIGTGESGYVMLANDDGEKARYKVRDLHRWAYSRPS